jgi:sporulation protein YlmC with PRC-barrel domain
VSDAILAPSPTVKDPSLQHDNTFTVQSDRPDTDSDLEVLFSPKPIKEFMNNSSVISSDKVEGTNVYDTAGEKLGSIDDLMIDQRSGQVRYAVLEFGGFLGMGTDRYPIPWSMLKYDDGKSGYIVPLDKAKLEKAPKYTDERAPTYDTEYGKRVNSYYGAEN